MSSSDSSQLKFEFRKNVSRTGAEGSQSNKSEEILKYKNYLSLILPYFIQIFSIFYSFKATTTIFLFPVLSFGKY